MNTAAISTASPDSHKTFLESATIFFLLQALLVAVMLHASYRSGFYEVDDKAFIEPITKDSWTEYLWTYSMPVIVTSFRLDYVLFGGTQPPSSNAGPQSQSVSSPSEPAAAGTGLKSSGNVSDSLAPPMRLMNAFYQIIAGLFLWLFLRRIQAGTGIAFLVALLWTAHPMNCENICWVVERKSVLCSLFGFASLLAWTWQSRWRIPVLNLLFMLALLSKPTALGLFPLFVTLEVFVRPRDTGFKAISWRNLFITAGGPLLSCAALLILNVMTTFKNELVNPPGGTVWTAALTDAEIFFRYMRSILVPFRLSFYYGVDPIVSLADPRLWIFGSAILILLGAIICLASREERPLAILGCIWFFAGLGPHSNLLSIPFWMQDRYTVLAIPGLLLATFVGAKGLVCRLTAEPKWLRGVAAMYVIIFTLLLAYRSSFYANSDLLTLDAVKNQPLSGFANLNAALLFHHEMRSHSPTSASPDREIYKLGARKAAFHFDAFLKCPDHTNFRETFDAKLTLLELLGELGLHAQVKHELADWLPPRHLKMLPDSSAAAIQKYGERKSYALGYLSNTLARAWALSAECSYQMAMDPKLPREKQRALLDEAVQNSDQSLAVKPNDECGRIVKARALLEISNRAGPQTDEARQKRAEAIEVLKGMPKESSWFLMAESILKSVQPAESRPQ